MERKDELNVQEYPKSYFVDQLYFARSSCKNWKRRYWDLKKRLREQKKQIWELSRQIFITFKQIEKE